jgi:hypothetical protein
MLDTGRWLEHNDRGDVRGGKAVYQIEGKTVCDSQAK